VSDHAGTCGPTGAGGRGPGDPPPGTRRWTARRKAAVVGAVAAGRLTLEAACRAYDLSPEELAAWKQALDRHGLQALKVTHGREFRAATVPTAGHAPPGARRASAWGRR
jgi:transposase-like protein